VSGADAIPLYFLADCLFPGINLSVYYSTVIFSKVGLSDFLSQLLAAVMNTGFAAGTWFLPMTIERIGRRSILIWSAAVLTTCMLIFVIMIGLPHPTLATQWTAVAFVIVYNFVFGYGWIGVPWLYGPEVGSQIKPGRPQSADKIVLRLLP